MLHDDKDLFRQVIEGAAKELQMSRAIVEKDYYVTALLAEISKRTPDLVFKGGTSLSKCYKIIQRFSEDIDLNLSGVNRPTEGQRRALKHNITDSIDALNLALANPENVRSKRDFNCYMIDYRSQYHSGSVKDKLQVETAVFLRTYPYGKAKATSYIQDFLEKSGRNELVNKLELPQCELNVQSIERTLIDKCFAVADYYMTGRTDSHSRHLYDIYRLMEYIKVDNELKALAETVRLDRQADAQCPSAKENVDLNSVLKEILKKAVYEKDYAEVTENILYPTEHLPYSEAVKGLQEVIDSKLFVKSQDTIAKPKEAFILKK